MVFAFVTNCRGGSGHGCGRHRGSMLDATEPQAKAHGSHPHAASEFWNKGASVSMLIGM